MMIARWIPRLLNGVLDRLAVLAGALGFSQIPGFMQHYLQRLGGHLGEARRNLLSWQHIADLSTDGDLQALIQRYRGGAAPEVIEAGRKCAADALRVEQLQQAYDALVSASAWWRPVVLLEHLDRHIARGALEAFEPNLPVNLEGLCYIVVGVVVGWCLFRGLRCGCCVAWRAACRHRRTAPHLTDAA